MTKIKSTTAEEVGNLYKAITVKKKKGNKATNKQTKKEMIVRALGSHTFTDEFLSLFSSNNKINPMHTCTHTHTHTHRIGESIILSDVCLTLMGKSDDYSKKKHSSKQYIQLLKTSFYIFSEN